MQVEHVHNGSLNALDGDESNRAGRQDAAVRVHGQAGSLHIAHSGPGVAAEELLYIPFPLHPPSWLTRVFEVALASIMLLLTAPLMLAIAWIIRRDTPGAALFVQERVGIGGKPIRFVKFRTFYADAKTRFPELYSYRYDERQLRALKLKLDDDPRVTPVGRWLRKTSLDELPNLWNLLTGEVALVGPRPEIPQLLPYYKGEMLRKYSVRPGITGLAQVSGRGRLGFLETAEYDVKYVRTRSFVGDIRLVLKTIRLVLLQDGAF